jgi:hypothetical protein
VPRLRSVKRHYIRREGEQKLSHGEDVRRKPVAIRRINTRLGRRAFASLFIISNLLQSTNCRRGRRKLRYSLGHQMNRLFWILTLGSALNPLVVATAGAADAALASIDHRIVKEPVYEAAPRYLLLALGPEAATRVWVVEDGRKLYVDKNANGDLMDDGPPIVPSGGREWQRSVDSDAKSRDFDYILTDFAPPGRPAQKDLQLRRWNYGESDVDSYGLSLTLDGKIPMYAGWFGSFWAASPSDAPIIHFGGPLTPKMLRYKDFTLGSGLRRLSVAFANPGLGSAATSLLSIDAPAVDVVPVLNIEWPTAAGGPPLRTSHRLDQRCCYWEFYTTEFEVPAGAAVGTAKVSIELPDGAIPIALTTTELEVPVVAARPVSPAAE